MSFHESDWLAALAKAFPCDRSGHLGIGDDAAVFPGPDGKSYVITQDALVEGVHFKRAWFTPEALALKAFRVNLSDVLAMGAVPRYVLLTVAWPESIDAAWVDGFLRGMQRACSDAAVLLIGGDTVRASTPAISITVTVIGDVSSDRLRLLSGAKAGDVLAVTGCLGDASAGLALCDQGQRSSDKRFVSLHQAFMAPDLPAAQAAVLAGCDGVHAMTDLSDGLYVDLPRMLSASAVYATVALESMPVSDALSAYVAEVGGDASEWALMGGEDYALLLSCDAAAFEGIQDALRARGLPKLHVLGQVTASADEADLAKEPVPRVCYRRAGQVWQPDAGSPKPFMHFSSVDSSAE